MNNLRILLAAVNSFFFYKNIFYKNKAEIRKTLRIFQE